MPHCSNQKEAFAIMGTLAQAPLREMKSTFPLCRGYLQCRRMIIEWVPSHIIIRGKELADRLAESGKGVPPNPMYLKKNLKVQVHRNRTSHSSAATQRGIFPSSRWSEGTEMPLSLSETIKRDNGHNS